ncbi:hypothetical protein PhaeoP88_04662 (plasmid) [Phaeobacter inhibens]|uniref:Uncharacterized protein n=1 Tax=Phaeobacter inhibens TaxID=221822 RepID=A0A2I7KHC8_9RHOB|nr:hypothetical protein PhaeoP88_04662 [Phaeobacter inhibens]
MTPCSGINCTGQSFGRLCSIFTAQVVAVFLKVFAVHSGTGKHRLSQRGLLMRSTAGRRTHLFNIKARGNLPEPIRIKTGIKPIMPERRDPYPVAPAGFPGAVSATSSSVSGSGSAR